MKQLSKEEMKMVMGGDSNPIVEIPGTCTVTAECESGSVTCSSDNGNCTHGDDFVQCDQDPIIRC